MFTFHIEAEDPIDETIRAIRQANMKVGIALKPKTSIDRVLPFLNDVDMVLIMTVEPGFGGQGFMPETMEKVIALRKLCPHLDIEVDGGISRDTVDIVARAGANVIVAGTFIFASSTDLESSVGYLRERTSLHLYGHSTET
jgi:ribulose-phosphate 3-epimerase